MLDPHLLEPIPEWFYHELSVSGLRTTRWFGANWENDSISQRRSTEDYWLLVVVAEGHVDITQQDQQVTVKTGQATILRPGSSHIMRCPDGPALVARIPLVPICDRSLPTQLLSLLPLPVAMPLIDPLNAQEQVTRIFKLNTDLKSNGPRLLGSCIANELLLNALAGGFAAGVLPKTRGTAWIAEAHAYILKHKTDPDLSVDSICTALKQSRSELHRQFAATYGYPPKEWIHRYRIAMAVRLLVSRPELTIEALMLRCGYRDRSQFYRHFKRLQGITPGALRQQQ